MKSVFMGLTWLLLEANPIIPLYSINQQVLVWETNNVFHELGTEQLKLISVLKLLTKMMKIYSEIFSN
jgi:hypothetical protein